MVTQLRMAGILVRRCESCSATVTGGDVAVSPCARVPRGDHSGSIQVLFTYALLSSTTDVIAIVGGIEAISANGSLLAHCLLREKQAGAGGA